MEFINDLLMYCKGFGVQACSNLFEPLEVYKSRSVFRIFKSSVLDIPHLRSG